MSEIIVKRHFINAKHGQLHLRVAGEATSQPAILCLHMMPKSGRVFTKVMRELAKNRLVIAPDYPGYGESDPYRDILQPRVEDYVATVKEVVTQFDLDVIDLVGYHTGSMVSVALAHQEPELVRKVVNLSAPLFNTSEVEQFLKYYSAVPLDENGTRFKTMWDRVIQYRGPGMTLEMAAESFAENLRGGERYEDGHYAAFKFTERYAQMISEIEQPLWILNLNDDLYEHSKRAEPLFNNGRLTDFIDWGHGFLVIWPREVAEQILRFFDQRFHQ